MTRANAYILTRFKMASNFIQKLSIQMFLELSAREELQLSLFIQKAREIFNGGMYILGQPMSCKKTNASSQSALSLSLSLQHQLMSTQCSFTSSRPLS